MNNPLLLTLAAEAAKDPPILDIDGTVFVQLAIFVITAIVLSRYLFRPYLEVKTARSSGTEGAKEEARRLQEEGAARMADYENRLSEARHQANQERSKLQAEAVKRDGEITAAARNATQAALESARAKLETEAEATRQQLEPRAQEIGRSIARKILGREVA